LHWHPDTCDFAVQRGTDETPVSAFLQGERGLGVSDLDEPLREDSSEYVEGTRMMKRTEMTK